mgnify:CR=1 FL=1
MINKETGPEGISWAVIKHIKIVATDQAYWCVIPDALPGVAVDLRSLPGWCRTHYRDRLHAYHTGAWRAAIWLEVMKSSVKPTLGSEEIPCHPSVGQPHPSPSRPRLAMTGAASARLAGKRRRHCCT